MAQPCLQSSRSCPSGPPSPTEMSQPLPLCVYVSETRSAVEDPGTKSPPKPRLGKMLRVTDVTPDSVGLSWTVSEGQFDSFEVHYKGRDGQPQVVPVEGNLREVSVSGLDPAHRYKLLLYGLREGERVDQRIAIATTGECGRAQNRLSLLPARLSWPDPVT